MGLLLHPRSLLANPHWTAEVIVIVEISSLLRSFVFVALLRRNSRSSTSTTPASGIACA